MLHLTYYFAEKCLFPLFKKQKGCLRFVTGLKFDLFGVTSSNLKTNFVFGLPEGHWPNEKTVGEVVSMVLDIILRLDVPYEGRFVENYFMIWSNIGENGTAMSKKWTARNNITSYFASVLRRIQRHDSRMNGKTFGTLRINADNCRGQKFLFSSYYTQHCPDYSRTLNSTSWFLATRNICGIVRSVVLNATPAVKMYYTLWTWCKWFLKVLKLRSAFLLLL